MSDLTMLFQHLEQPEYVHVILNHLPLFGMAAGAFILGLSLALRRQGEVLAALVWIALVGLSTYPVVQSGHEGYDRVYAMSNTDAQAWLDVHADRAEKSEPLFYLTALVAIGALLTKKKWPKISTPLVYVSLFLSIVCVGLAGWVSQAGGQVRHSEFRDGPPSKTVPPHHETGDEGEDHRHDH